MFSIAFICTANMCRSVMAHAICVHELAQRGRKVDVYSAGIMNLTGAAPAELAWLTCGRNGTPTKKDGATFVGNLQLTAINRFLVMEQLHLDCLVKDYHVPAARISLLGSFDAKSRQVEIEDPIREGPAEFERCYARLRRCIKRYLDTSPDFVPAK